MGYIYIIYKSQIGGVQATETGSKVYKSKQLSSKVYEGKQLSSEIYGGEIQ